MPEAYGCSDHFQPAHSVLRIISQKVYKKVTDARCLQTSHHRMPVSAPGRSAYSPADVVTSPASPHKENLATVTVALSTCFAVVQPVVPGLVRAQYQVRNLVSNQEKTAKTTVTLPGKRLGLSSRSGQSLVGRGRNLAGQHSTIT